MDPNNPTPAQTQAALARIMAKQEEEDRIEPVPLKQAEPLTRPSQGASTATTKANTAPASTAADTPTAGITSNVTNAAEDRRRMLERLRRADGGDRTSSAGKEAKEEHSAADA